jgi:putative PEP-CTERM system integral membrane protein
MNGLLKLSFWGLNTCLLLIAYVGILPFIGRDFLPDLVAGILPIDLFLTFIGIIAIPTVACLSRLPVFAPNKNDNTYDREKGAIVNVHEAMSPLGKLFFGVEAPLLILCIARLFWLRELTPATTLLILGAGIAVLSFGFDLVRFDSSYSKILVTLQIVGHSLILLLGIYVGTIALFYLIPVIFVTVVALFYGVFFPPLFLFAIALVALCTLPYGMSVTYIQAWRGFSKRFTSVHGIAKTNLIASGAIASWILIIAIAQIQPQNQIFSLLETAEKGTDVNRQELVQKSNQVRSGLLNAYLARYRYPNYEQRNSIIKDFYRSDFLQSAHDFLISPFIYNGLPNDSVKAEALYAKFFDRPILRGEQQAIQQAVNATFIRSDAKAGLLSVNQKKVLLAKQELSVKPNGDWAEVEIHETYRNQTAEQQEIFYAFSLPESAVLTGVWLGDTNMRSQAFPYVISPRGAAQAVYNAEVKRRVDPALLEQVGTRSYRLRVFPIPPNFGQKTVPEMNMWMSYKVIGTQEGWALPQLAEKRNIFWAKDTKRTYNSQAINGQNVSNNENNWFSPFISSPQPIQLQSHQIDFLTGDRIVAKPLQSQDYQLPQGQKFAIILDTSYSMNAHRREVEETFNILKTQKNEFDIYVAKSQGEKSKKIDGLNNFNLSDITFYGLLRPQELLQQFIDLNNSLNNKYDAILAITDEGNYELTDEKATTPIIPLPLWTIHLGGLPAAYDDATLAAIQTSGGGVGTDIQEVLQRIATQSLLAKTDKSLKNVVDGFAWYQESRDPKISLGTQDEFTPIAARQLIQTYSKNIGQSPKLSELDAVHTLAKRYSIVTPYSSMIVLVDDRQRAALKQAETRSDRFNRTTEDNQLPTPTSTAIPQISGVPEPSEWLLIGIVIFTLILISRRQSLQNTSLPDTDA